MTGIKQIKQIKHLEKSMGKKRSFNGKP